MPTWKAAKLDPLTNSCGIRKFFWPKTGHAYPLTNASSDTSDTADTADTAAEDVLKPSTDALSPPESDDETPTSED